LRVMNSTDFDFFRKFRAEILGISTVFEWIWDLGLGFGTTEDLEQKKI